MAVYGFNSQADFNRAVKSIKASENARMDVTPSRGRYPNAGASGGGGNFIEGRLTSAISPASNSLTGATTFTFRRFTVLDGSVEPKILQEEPDDETGVNRDTTLEADVDAYVHCKKINGEWRPSPVSDVCV